MGVNFEQHKTYAKKYNSLNFAMKNTVECLGADKRAVIMWQVATCNIKLKVAIKWFY